MRNRQIVDLKSAFALSGRPVGIPHGRARGAKAQGIRYEKLLADAMPEAKHGQWFEFWDRNGHGFCQSDLLISKADFMLILEAKYTWVGEGHIQLSKLYRPVVERVFKKPAYGVVVCKNLSGFTPRDTICSSLEEAVVRARSGRRAVLHWIGTTLEPLRPRAAPAPIASLLDL